MTFERRTRVVPGYDCRVTCSHTPKHAGRDGHGIHNEEWFFTLIDPKVGALSLCVGTGRFPSTVDTTQLTFAQGFNGRFLAMCTPYMTSLELVKTAQPPDECDYLGRCYHFGNWYLLADEFVRDTFIRDVETIAEPQPRLWAKLEEFFGAVANQIDVARHETGDLGWHQCPSCKGSGVLPGVLS